MVPTRISALLLGVCALFAALPAHAERLMFDHRTYQPLKDTLDKNDNSLILYDDRNPRYIYDLIVVQGSSTTQWSEGFEIIARTKSRNMAAPLDWQRELQSRLPARCRASFATVAQDENSLTFERRATGCPPNIAQTGLYRIVAGARSLFLLGALYKGEMPEPMRRQWLELLATARIEN